MKSFFFIVRTTLAWGLAAVFLLAIWCSFSSRSPPWIFGLAVTLTLLWVALSAFSHVRRVRLIAGASMPARSPTASAARSRSRFEAGEAFDLVDAADPRAALRRRQSRARATACRCARACGASIPT